MDTGVVIKANSRGIRIIFQNEESLEDILRDIKDKLYKSQPLLKKSGNVYVSFEGRELKQQEIDRLIYEMNNMPEVRVRFIYNRQDNAVDQLDIPPHRHAGDTASENIVPFYKKERAVAAPDKQDVSSMFYYGNLENGQTLETGKSVIIVGDVCRHARVISDGNIIVTGRLSGTAIAGRDLKQMRFVLALHMEPVHIKVGKCEAEFARVFHKKFNTKDAVIAYCANGQLIFNTLLQTSL